jgi:hypothetical protein
LEERPARAGAGVLVEVPMESTYAATVAAATSDHGPFSPRVLTHRRA